MASVDAKLTGMRNGTRLTLVGDRTGPISEENIVGNWVQFRVPGNNHAVTDAPDQCLSIIQSDGTPIAAGGARLSFRNDLWIRARELQAQEAQLHKSDATLQDEIARIETDRRNAAQWLERNSDMVVSGRCDRPPLSARPSFACAPEEEKEVAARLCKEAVIDCAVIATTMGKPGDSMFDSSFLGNQASQTCGLQTAKVVGDDYGIAGMLAAAMKDAPVKTAAQSIAADPSNPQLLEQLAQAVLASREFAVCPPKAEQTCRTLFRRWQAEMSQRLRRCQNARQTTATAPAKVTQLNERRAQVEQELAPIRQELITVRTGAPVSLRPGC